MDNESYLTRAAVDMADVYAAGIQGDVLSAEAYNELHGKFGKVPMELRANVFVKFIDELRERNVPFNLNHMKD